MQPPFYCDYGANIELGERVFFNLNCVVLDVCRVRIGDYALFGPAVQVYTATHPMNAALRRKQESGKPVEIGADVWVGGAAIILPGVTIGSRSVIGAGSAGDRALGEHFLSSIQPFIWRRSLDFGVIEEVREISARIRDHFAQGARLGPGFDLKRGRGGIREVEFFAQIQQMIHGGRQLSVRAPATLDALEALIKADRIDPADARALAEAETLCVVDHLRAAHVDADTLEIAVAGICQGRRRAPFWSFLFRLRH